MIGPSPEHIEEKIMLPGESFHMRTLTVHRKTNVEDTDVLEYPRRSWMTWCG